MTNKRVSKSLRELERLVLWHAMRVSSCWPDDLTYFHDNSGLLLRMLRACKRLKKARKA